MAIAAPPDPTRRTFLDWLIGLGTAGWLGTVLYPVLRYLRPVSGPAASGPFRLTAEEVARMERDHFVIVRSGTARVMVFDCQGTLRALDARCTHEGCTVQYVPGETSVWCACHNGRFDIDGRVVAGPPPRPLRRWIATREGDGSVVVTRDAA